MSEWDELTESFDVERPDPDLAEPDEQPCANTDRELYREDTGDPAGSYYENSVHVTADGGIGMNVGGRVIVQPIAVWHEQATRATTAPTAVTAPVPRPAAPDTERVEKIARAIYSAAYLVQPWKYAGEAIRDYYRRLAAAALAAAGTDGAAQAAVERVRALCDRQDEIARGFHAQVGGDPFPSQLDVAQVRAALAPQPQRGDT